MSISIFTTVTNPIQRGDTFIEAMNCYTALADEVVVINSGNPANLPNIKTFEGQVKYINSNIPWGKEFTWPIIGAHFQEGYENCSGDWVIHMDIDWLFHQIDFDNIREALKDKEKPALSFFKRQFIQPDAFNVKSRLVIAVNKNKYGDRIRFDSGGDLCQPSLDGEYLKPDYVTQIRIPIWNYECLLKTKEQLLEDKGRFARAWHNWFREYKLGGPDDLSAYKSWLRMMKGRYKKDKMQISLSKHPIFIRDTLENLPYDVWGNGGFGAFDA